MARTLLVTNDFPPRPGGIQSYLHALATRLPPDELVVLASTWARSEDARAACSDEEGGSRGRHGFPRGTERPAWMPGAEDEA